MLSMSWRKSIMTVESHYIGLGNLLLLLSHPNGGVMTFDGKDLWDVLWMKVVEESFLKALRSYYKVHMPFQTNMVLVRM